MNWVEIFQKLGEGVFSFINKAEDNFESRVAHLERRLELKLENFRRQLFKTAFELLFLVLSILLLLFGAIIFLTRFFPIDMVLFGAGLVCLYIIFLIRLLK
jgi:hypothetical protein